MQTFLNKFSRKLKIWILIIIGVAIIVPIIITFLLNSTTSFVPLYSNLTASETGQIKQTLDSKGVKYKISNNGTTISVPKSMADNLKVDLAAQGIPQTGNIDYSFFGKNASWGMTDNQFNVLERAAMQTELANLITGVSGIQSAKVMINLPNKSVWVTDKPNKASVSVVLNLEAGHTLTNTQVQTLYNLISKSIPNLPKNNIVIMDQMFNYFEPKNSNSNASSLSVYDQQQQIQHDIEKNIQQRVQQMLGMMMGPDKVMVNVTTNIDFTKSQSDEKLVTPVDTKKIQGLAKSTDQITETYSGAGASGVAGTGTNSVPTYQGTTSSGGNGNYSHVENQVNYAFNQIHKTVTSSPYKINDMGIQVLVEPPNPNNPASLPPKRLADIKNIVGTIIRTTLTNTGGKNLTTSQINQRAVVSVEKFNGKSTVPTPTAQANPLPKWIYITAGLAGAIILFLVILLIRRRRPTNEEAAIRDLNEREDRKTSQLYANEGVEQTPERTRKRELEQMAKEQPDEFVKLLRTWLSEEQ